MYLFALVVLLLLLLFWVWARKTLVPIWFLRLPRLTTLQDLRRSEWYPYLCSVYSSNEWTEEDLPVDMSTFQFLYLSKIPVSIPIPRDPKAYTPCPQHENQLYANMPGFHNPPDSLYVYRPPPYKALAADSWVEVAHCVDPHIQKTEVVGCWFYYLPGTGIYFCLGKTIAFPDHTDASLYFLGKRCSDTECSADTFTAMFTEAAKRGYDSVQFLNHGDMRCGNTAIEIVDVRGRGSDNCCDHPSAFRSGWNAKNPSCPCDSGQTCLNCGK